MRVPNGDYLNDMWLYDWNTGNWTAYNPNELVCEEVQQEVNERMTSKVTCTSRQMMGRSSHAQKRTEQSGRRSPSPRKFGAKCEYHTTCFDWTGLRRMLSQALRVA